MRGNTTQRGYGYAHQQEVKAARAAFIPGQLCGYCGKPIWDVRNTHLAHNPPRTAYLGLWHADCNDREAAIRGNRLRGIRRHGALHTVTTIWRPSRDW